MAVGGGLATVRRVEDQRPQPCHLDSQRGGPGSSTGWNPVVGGQNLGAVPMSDVQFGDDVTGRVYS
jgi:hypothetical protein